MSGVETGRGKTLAISENAGVTFRTIGSVSVKDANQSSPAQDVTSQDITGDTASMCHTGYETLTLPVSGFVKQKVGVDPDFGQALFTYKDLVALVSASPVKARKGLFRLANSAEAMEGNFLISDFNRTGGQTDVQEYSMTLVAEGTEGGIAYYDGSLYDFMIFMESTLPDLWAPF